MKFCRIGYTEGSLLFIYWLKYLSNLKLEYDEITFLNNEYIKLLNWLHSTSGFYNKKISASYFDINIDDYNHEILNEYLDTLYKSLSYVDILWVELHDFNEKILSYKQQFIDSFKSKKYSPLNQDLMYSSMRDKKVLIISSFGKLIKNQNDSGNLKKIYANYPEIKNMIYYTTPYTFFNNGPDNNILETCRKVYEDIEKIKDDFDVAIISFGAYSNLLGQYININLNKDIFTLGGNITTWFGILNVRTKEFHIKNNIILDNKEYYITEIPEEYKPNDYMKIENGCYW